MTALPASTAFTGASITEAQFKTAITDLRGYLAGLLGTDGAVATAAAALDVLFAAGVDAKSSAYTVATSDRGKLLDCTGTWTLSLPAASSAGAGFAFCVVNSGAGIITIDANGAELIDGAATATLDAGLSIILVCTGAAWLGATRSTEPYAEPTLATGSNVYMHDLTEITADITSGSYPASLSARSTDYAISRWVGGANLLAVRVDHHGEVTVSVDIKRANFNDCSVRLMRNGSQQEEWATTTSYVTKTKNVSVARGDVLLLQAKRGTSNSNVFVRNFKLLVDVAP